MISTWFDVLNKYPEFDQAFVAWEVSSVDINEMDAIMVIDRKIFPNIEIKFVSKAKDGTSPQLVKSIWGRYVRGHRQFGDSLDGIVFENGNYLSNISYRNGDYRPAFSVKEMEGTDGRKLILTPEGLRYLTELNSRGYSAGSNFGMKPKTDETILPRVRPPFIKSEVPSPRLLDSNIRSSQCAGKFR